MAWLNVRFRNVVNILSKASVSFSFMFVARVRITAEDS